MDNVFGCAVLFFQSAITFLLAGSVTLRNGDSIGAVAQTAARFAGLAGMVVFGLLMLVALWLKARSRRWRMQRQRVAGGREPSPLRLPALVANWSGCRCSRRRRCG